MFEALTPTEWAKVQAPHKFCTDMTFDKAEGVFAITIRAKQMGHIFVDKQDIYFLSK